MMAQTGRESAKIIPFPVRARAASSSLGVKTAGLREQPIPYCDFGSGSYHEAAIRDEQPGRKA